MDLKNVKAIEVPTYSSDYRQLEYIHFNGAESIYIGNDLLATDANGRLFNILFSYDNTDNALLLGFSNDSITGTRRVIVRLVGGHPMVQSGANGQSYSVSALTTNIKIEFHGKIVTTNDPTYTWGLTNFGYKTASAHYDTTFTNFNAAITGNATYIGRNSYNNTSKKLFWTGNFYGYTLTNISGSLYYYNLVPAQRKSDDVCGVYDLNTNTFYAMTGTTITSAAAGPIVNENLGNITVINKSVKKIEDSNGNIIWGSQAAFPYRRLEYIKFSGAEYVEENFDLATKNRKIVLEYTCDEFIANSTLLGQWNNTVTANQRRIYIARCNNTSGQAIWYMGSKFGVYDNMSLNTKYKSTVTYTNASANTLTYDFKNSLGTTLASGTLTETSTSIPTIDSKAALGTTKLKDANGNISYGGYWNGKLYKFEKYVASTNTLQNNQFPCQRKSDGVCGLYDTVGNTFLPMSGTDITDAAAGPTVDEYWNLQA